ncbi:MAG TPA: carboxypeptidase regulatory-like domain-containing protein [Longimicrobium sp.]|jgi:hypothetical protein
MRIFRYLAPVLGLLCAKPLAAQQTAATTGATIRGVVTDSVAGAPLAEATVQLVQTGVAAPNARTATTDAAGRFSFAGVPAGRYALGFLHPVLDSLGLEPIARQVQVAGQGEVRADLAIPAPARLRSAFCGAEGSTGGMVMGFVRAAEGGAPVPGATVVGEWMELSIGTGGMSRQTARRTATTGANGGFLLCDVPTPGTVMLVVSRGGEGTDRIDAEVPGSGFLRRDLFLGEARMAARADTARAAGDTVPPLPRTRTGPGRLTGTVVTTDGGRPLPGAQVSVVNGVPTRANANGEWTLTGAPSGTRMLEVRAPGYYPVLRVVDIADGARPVRVALSRLAAMLDTVRVTARSGGKAARAGFDERRRSWGTGRFFTADDLQRRLLVETSDLFKNMPGVSSIRGVDGGESLLMRNAFGDACAPTLYFNGLMMRNLTGTDLDSLVQPQEIAAIEVYAESQVPPQFQDALSGCGSIVVWTK